MERKVIKGTFFVSLQLKGETLFEQIAATGSQIVRIGRTARNHITTSTYFVNAQMNPGCTSDTVQFQKFIGLELNKIRSVRLGVVQYEPFHRSCYAN